MKQNGMGRIILDFDLEDPEELYVSLDQMRRATSEARNFSIARFHTNGSGHSLIPFWRWSDEPGSSTYVPISGIEKHVSLLLLPDATLDGFIRVLDQVHLPKPFAQLREERTYRLAPSYPTGIPPNLLEPKIVYGVNLPRSAFGARPKKMRKDGLVNAYIWLADVVDRRGKHIPYDQIATVWQGLLNDGDLELQPEMKQGQPHLTITDRTKIMQEYGLRAAHKEEVRPLTGFEGYTQDASLAGGF